ncbi:MAG: D-erythronate dehydrogenase [Paracoccaceae bacterium]
MHILIIGAAGMIGARLTSLLATRGTLGDEPIHHLTLADVVAPTAPPFAGAITTLAVDIANPATATKLIAARPQVIFHLAAIVSAQAEAEMDLGYAINLDGSRALFQAIRHAAYAPRLVFASSTAVFGTPFPDKIPDDFHSTPRSSYGTQKAATELLLNDYTRRGFLDGIALRLPTICIRPGLPNRAASGFYSNILREPLAGKPANLPVPDTTRHWFASPNSAVHFFDHAATLNTETLGTHRALNMPGLSATVAEQIEALRRAAGQKAVDLITHIPDPAIAAIVNTWPQDFAPTRALSLGFTADHSFDQIIAAHLTP